MTLTLKIQPRDCLQMTKLKEITFNYHSSANHKHIKNANNNKIKF